MTKLKPQAQSKSIPPMTSLLSNSYLTFRYASGNVISIVVPIEFEPTVDGSNQAEGAISAQSTTIGVWDEYEILWDWDSGTRTLSHTLTQTIAVLDGVIVVGIDLVTNYEAERTTSSFEITVGTESQTTGLEATFQAANFV